MPSWQWQSPPSQGTTGDRYKTGSVKDLSSRKFKGQHENIEEKSRSD